RRHGTPVMAPAGGAKDIHELVRELVRLFHIIPNILEFMSENDHRIIGIGGMDDPILHINVIVEFLPSTKDLVKDIEEPPMVLVQILHILCVVDLVHGMGVQEFLQKAQFWDIDRMQLKLAKGLDSQTDHHHLRGKTNRRQPGIKEGFVQNGEPTVADGRSQVEIIRGMVYDMSGPKYPDFMVGPVEPIVGEIIRQLAKDPDIPNIAKGFVSHDVGAHAIDHGVAQVVDGIKKYDGEGNLEQRAQNGRSHSHEATSSQILPIVEVIVPMGLAISKFKYDKSNKNGYSVYQGVGDFHEKAVLKGKF